MKKIISILLSLAMLAGFLTGCTAAGTPREYIPVGDQLVQGDEEQQKAEIGVADENFALAYNPQETLNPLSAADFTNRMLFSLVYQGLFTTNRDGEVLPILCKNYTASSDLTVYSFTIDPRATFSDGVPVTPEDVAASLKESMNHKYFGRRLRFVNVIEVTEDGQVRIYLNQPNGNLPLLLDIPIVKATEVESENPLGTGPYKFKGWGTHRSMVRRDNFQGKLSLNPSLLLLSYQLFVPQIQE